MVLHIVFGTLPPKCQLTVSINQWSFDVSSGTPFCGVKNVPSDTPVFMHVIPSGASTENTPPCDEGFWLSGENLWYSLVVSDSNIVCQRMDFEPNPSQWAFMVQYTGSAEWEQLTAQLKWSQMQEIMGSSGAVLSLSSSTPTVEEKEYVDRLLKTHEAANITDIHLQYTPIRFKSREAIRPGHERNDFTDKSYYSTFLLQNKWKSKSRFIGELQLCFLHVALLGNYGSSLQWHSMLSLAIESVSNPPIPIAELDDILAKQLHCIPDVYMEALANILEWRKWFRSRGDELPKTLNLITERFPDVLDTTDDEEDEKDDDQSSEDAPTVVQSVTYLRNSWC